MIRIRKADERGQADFGWLKARYTFAFNRYYDPAHVRFRSLRVMNEDVIAAGRGFGTHPHDNMEIVTYVLSGALEHRDSMGNGEVLRPGEFQRMTAGTGITHSEFNPSADEPTHLYQIWLLPEREGLEPSYEQKRFDTTGRLNGLQLVASPDAAQNSLKIHQDVRIYLADLEPGHQLNYKLAHGRHAWMQVLHGQIDVNGHSLATSDGAAISEESSLELQSAPGAKIMLFDLA